MLQVMILLIVLVIAVIMIFGGYKKNIFLVFMNMCFIGMLCCLLCYFVKIGGTLPTDAMILYGNDTILQWVGSLPLELNDLGLWLNIFRFGTVFMFFVHACRSNISVKMALKGKKYFFLLFALPIIAIVYFSNPSLLYNDYAYNYVFQAKIVNWQFYIICLYVIASFVLLIIEGKLIALSWYKGQHMANLLQMALFFVPYILFAQFDPILIYQDYMRVCVFTSPWLLSSGSPTLTWVIAFSVCVLALISMIIQNYLFLKFDYDRTKLELSISQKVSSAELTASMLLHGLKNQLLAESILAKKLNKELNSENPNSETMKELSEKVLAVNADMSDKLSYLYKTVDRVKTVLNRVSTDEVIKAIKKKVKSRDTENIVHYSYSDGGFMADTELLSEAIFNIIVNAIEAVENTQNKKIVVRIAFTRNHTLITITDNGCGIRADMRSSVFMPFASTKNSSVHWGLGLCYASRIIKQHMGDVRFESQEKHGTVFYITLPRYLDERKGGFKWKKKSEL